MNHTQPSPDTASDRGGWSLPLQLLGALLAVGLVTGGLFWWGIERWGEDDPDNSFEIARTVVTFVGILGATVLAVIAIRRQGSTELTHLLEVERTGLDRERDDREVVRALRERYTTTAEQLGHDSPAIRLAGVYALAALADDWIDRQNKSETQTCIDVLCAYLRTPRTQPEDDLEAADQQVQGTVVRVISAHLQTDHDHSWSVYDFDFTKAHFTTDIDFSGAEFSGERTSFFRVTFGGERTWFKGTKFAGRNTSFVSAEFSSGHTTFERAEFTGEAPTFIGAKFFSQYTSFIGVQFSGGATIFSGVEFSGEAIMFDGSKFFASRTWFHKTKFSGLRASFDGAEFPGQYTSFRGAIWDGVEATFDHLIATDRTVIKGLANPSLLNEATITADGHEFQGLPAQ